VNSFKDFNLSDSIVKALDHQGFTTPTEIQAKAIPALIAQEKVDFHGQAQTGTGKTLAFSIPLLQKVDAKNKQTQGLIVAPTRELVLQICESLEKMAAFSKGVSVVPVYGGVSIERQISQLKRGAHIVVGTPGRLNDHIRRRNVSLKNLSALVLDEADIMLDMGFKQDIDFILEKSCSERQIWLFSATTNRNVDSIKKKHMNDPVSVRICKKNVTAKNTEQFFCILPERYRFQALCRIIDTQSDFYGIIFCQTKLLTADVAQLLTQRGYNAGSLHGDMDQKMRNKVIKKFKSKSIELLVATDVAARGIDVSDLTHVINYSFPEDQDSYVHRIGRTGRAGKKGTAITFINGRQVGLIRGLAKRTSSDIKPVEVPTVDDVMKVKIERALGYFNDLCNKNSSLNGALEPLKSSIHTLSRDQLVNGAINILSDKFLRAEEIGKDIPDFSSEDFESRGYRGGRGGRDSRGGRGGRDSRGGDRQDLRMTKGMSEIVLHIGSEDGIRKSDIVRHCVSSNAISKNQIERVRVIKRRSFVVVSSTIAKKALSALKGKDIQQRRVRVGLSNLN